jgi:hypothetical protein
MEALKAIKAKCIRDQRLFRITVVDAVPLIKVSMYVPTFAVVVQDLKHLINRLVKELRKKQSRIWKCLRNAFQWCSNGG